MILESLKKVAKTLKPSAEKIAVDTARGYAFGCVFSLFSNNRKSLTRNMHEKGKLFAKMSAAYSATEIILQKTRKEDDFKNSAIAGAVAGSIGSNNNKLISACVFGAYSGLSDYMQRI